MSTKKKAAGLSALKNLVSSEDTTEEPKPVVKQKPATRRPATSKTSTTKAPTSKPRAKASPSPVTKSKTDKVGFALHLPEEAHAKIREIAFHEKDSMTQLILEGIDMLFESRGLPPLAKPPQEDK